ncbi:MAG TPA: 2-C-methyl-D-erythritol 2,4-cyclodiphosphate synthase [Clostridia bacterium]|jgi:2-C-methyl-D-erythritol 4-phosphate cytidylyltransferase/2-C-methyl-D-erythritol 2,4-cyclodiphosphate synthase|nr:2-C-methyl-D-erythritol 2,4-cyclodiphosphate synthase [Clostridia bacterium]
MREDIRFDVIITAAGKSERMGVNKMALTISRQTTLERTVEAFMGMENIENIIIAVNDENISIAKDIASRNKNENIIVTKGGKSREETVYLALKDVKSEYVLIHDGARPFVSKKLIKEVMECASIDGSAIPVLKPDDSMRRIDGDKIIKTVNRDKYCLVQTPQGFLTESIRMAFNSILSDKKSFADYTDESEIYLEYVREPSIVAGDKRNIKLTDPSDAAGLNTKIGSGYDIHALIPGRSLVICGVQVDYHLGSLAHSDGDVAVHALIDAVLSAAGELDIGSHFPDSDPKYADIDSTIMLTEALSKLNEKNLKVTHASIVVLLEKPKLADYIPIMRVRLGNVLKIPSSDITISAKTGEGLGEIGEGRAIAAYAMVIAN